MMCEDPNDKVFEFQFQKGTTKEPPKCDVCGKPIDLGVPESYHSVYWRALNGDLFTHIACL